MLFHATLLAAALLCSLVAGLLFTFAVVVMPGIRRLDDAGFIRAFQVIDGAIQKNQPLFMLVWLGSVLALAAALVLGLWQLTGINRVLIGVAALLYVVGVQVPTITINIPLNNRLQRLDVVTMNEAARRQAREEFEARWNQSNANRTVCAILASIVLLVLLLEV
jgi:uncharacterized membrane protein